MNNFFLSDLIFNTDRERERERAMCYWSLANKTSRIPQLFMSIHEAQSHARINFFCNKTAIDFLGCETKKFLFNTLQPISFAVNKIIWAIDHVVRQHVFPDNNIKTHSMALHNISMRMTRIPIQSTSHFFPTKQKVPQFER